MAVSEAYAEQLCRRVVEAQDPALRVDLDDGVGRPVDDRSKLEPLQLERRPQLGVAEGDGQLVAG